jgi:protein ATS1
MVAVPQSSMPLFGAGSNARGQLGNGSEDDAHSFIGATFDGLSTDVLQRHYEIVHISCGANHTLALARNLQCGRNELWGSGDGSLGQLGPSLKDAGSTSVFKKIDVTSFDERLSAYTIRLLSASWQTSYLVLSSDEASDLVLTMGSNEFGDLGIGNSPVGAFHFVDFTHLGIGSNFTVECMATGRNHVVLQICAIESDTTKRYHVVGWGFSRHGQLGPMVSLDSRCQMYPQLLRPVTTTKEILQIALGGSHSVFLLRSGGVSAYGSDKKNQLGALGELGDVSSIDCTWNGTYVAWGERGNTLITSMGSNNKGQLGNASAQNTHSAVVQFPFSVEIRVLQNLACGSEHILALFSCETGPPGKEVWGWGWNEHGNLGLGSTNDQTIPCKIPLEKPERIWAGPGTSWIYTKL